jgi:hypothetical protein
MATFLANSAHSVFQVAWQASAGIFDFSKIILKIEGGG